MRRPPRSARLAACLAVLAAVLLAVSPASPARAAGLFDLDDPSPWPSAPGADPDLIATAQALRISGPDRYQTNLASLLTLRGQGQFPFGTSDRTSGNAARLADASGWWGARRCPSAVIVVAGDTFADALAASVLSDPTDQSTEPLLERTAAADPLFDPIGGFDRVDTDAAPILITTSGRAGASGLDLAGQVGAQDLSRGGCTTARSAVVVGGIAAVPAGVEDDLVTLGYTQIFRVAGVDRYDTAGRVARSLGTAPVPPGTTGCADPDATDGSRTTFYANSVVEYREAPTSCRLLSRTVVLTDGLTGADALAAGWWTSYWQVPVLLTGAGGALPLATSAALTTLDIDTLVVLGGTSRIPESTVQGAASIAGAEVIRIAGTTRADTSVQMARLLGGWWPAGPAAYAGSLVCLAASSGDGPTAQGWPDALGAGPWCATLAVGEGAPGAPDRALAPTSGAAPRTTGGGVRPAHDAAPILLVEAGATTLPAPVATLLDEAFAPGGDWCTSATASPTCAVPGFAVAFGGQAVITPDVLADVTRRVDGARTAVGGDERTPTLGSGFVTSLDLAPVFRSYGDTGEPRACVLRGGAVGVRWLSVTATPERTGFQAQGDLMLSGAYRTDADGVLRSPGTSSPSCVRFAGGASGQSSLSGVSLSARMAPSPTLLRYATGQRLTLSGPVTQVGPDAATGPSSDLDGDALGTSTLTFTDTALGGVGVTIRGATTPLTRASITLALARGDDAAAITAPDRVTGTVTLSTSLGDIAGEFEGEAIRSGAVWHIRGEVRLAAGPALTGGGNGGFSADLDTRGAGSPVDDVLTWRLDAGLQ
ncbi:MAG: cell wall-binding repeat-containing protein [Acidimicrobiales bacterium]|nr:cell wall-binding repeat-containing protein [Acidimicrobiales bacterium]